MFNFFSGIFRAVADIVRSVVQVIVDVVRAVINALVAIVQFVVKAISGVIKWFADLFGDGLGAVILLIVVIIVMYFCAPCAQFLITAANTVWSVVTTIWTTVSSAVSYAWANYVLPAWTFVKDMAIAAWDWIASAASAIWSKVSAFALTGWDMVKEVGSTIGSAVGYASKLIGENPVLATALGAAALGVDWKIIAFGAAAVYVLTHQGGDNASSS